MPRCQLTQLTMYPVGNALKLLVIVVHGGYDIGDDLNMHLPLILSPLGDLKDTPPVAYPGQLAVEGIVKALDINPPGIQLGTDGIQSLWSHVAIGHIDGIQVVLLG